MKNAIKNVLALVPNYVWAVAAVAIPSVWAVNACMTMLKAAQQA